MHHLFFRRPRTPQQRRSRGYPWRGPHGITFGFGMRCHRVPLIKTWSLACIDPRRCQLVAYRGGRAQRLLGLHCHSIDQTLCTPRSQGVLSAHHLVLEPEHSAIISTTCWCIHQSTSRPRSSSRGAQSLYSLIPPVQCQCNLLPEHRIDYNRVHLLTKI